MEGSKNKLCDMHRSRRRARILTSVLISAVLTGAIALIVYVSYRPVKPQASVSRAAVYQLESAGSGVGVGNNASSSSAAPPYALAARMQFTVVLHNPSDRAALLYDGLLAYVLYRGEVVAPPVALPSLAQERGADVALSPLFGLGGGGGGGGGGAPIMPVSEQTVRALEADCAARRVLLRLVVLGHVRFKSGPFKTGWHDLFVRCDVNAGLGLDAAAGGGGAAGGVPLLEYPQCFVDA